MDDNFTHFKIAFPRTKFLTKDWSIQASYGSIKSPEQLEPNVDQDRFTVSATYNKSWGKNNWQTTFGWGRNINNPGNTLDAFLLESSINFNKTHTIFGRLERVSKDELFEENQPLHGTIFTVNKVSLGYIYDFPEWNELQFGVGGMGSVALLPSRLTPTYGDTPVSYEAFFRVKF